MKYKVTVFGVKDTSENIVTFIQENICPVDLIITISPEVTKKNQVSGYKGLSGMREKYGITVHQADSYFLTDEKTQRFLEENEFEIGISMGWQRLIPPSVLDRFQYGIYGFHGNCGYLPFGRGRSPLNWSIILGDTRFNLNLFRYDEKADSPNIFATEMFSLTPHDDIRTAQYKNMICSKNLVRKLLLAYQQGNITVRTDSRDFDSWYGKRTAADGKVDFRCRTREIYNLVRGVAAPFPGAYAWVGEGEECRITLWEAHPFDEMIDFSGYRPGEVIDIFDGRLVVRTVDGSLLIDRYECGREIHPGDILR
ncbi:bifunctional polymyxin resistance protein ArnA [Lachnospiraceae bacterium]|nr:bifunctional polymyxin resistance protein ArnA [Lachnospiraceae bacterium]